MSQTRRRQETRLKAESSRNDQNEDKTRQTGNTTVQKRLLRGNSQTRTVLESQEDEIDSDSTPIRKTRHTLTTTIDKSLKTKSNVGPISLTTENVWPASTPNRKETRKVTSSKLVNEFLADSNDNDDNSLEDSPNSVYLTPHQKPRTIPKNASPSMRDYQKLERRLFPQTSDYRQDARHNYSLNEEDEDDELSFNLDDEDDSMSKEEHLPDDGRRPGPWSRDYAQYLSHSIKKLGSFTNPCIERTLSIPLLFLLAVLWVVGTTLNNSGYTELVDPFSVESSFSTYAHDIKPRHIFHQDEKLQKRHHSQSNLDNPTHFQSHQGQRQLLLTEEQKDLVARQKNQHQQQLTELNHLGEQLKTELQQFTSKHLIESNQKNADDNSHVNRKNIEQVQQSNSLIVKQMNEINILKEQVTTLHSSLNNVSALATALQHHIQQLSEAQHQISQKQNILIENEQDSSQSSQKIKKDSSITQDEVTDTVNKMIAIAQEKYSADGIGLADFALESTGARVIESMTSATYEITDNISQEKVEDDQGSFHSIFSFFKHFIPWSESAAAPITSPRIYSLTINDAKNSERELGDDIKDEQHKNMFDWIVEPNDKESPIRATAQSMYPVKISRPPETAIRSNTEISHCWPLKGSRGQLTILLSRRIVPKAVTIDHVSSLVGHNMQSAPKDFQVYGIYDEHNDETSQDQHIGEQQSILLGSFVYNIDISSNTDEKAQFSSQSFFSKNKQILLEKAALEGQSAVQTFTLDNPLNKSFDFIQLKVLSNHGQKSYTCIYRFRVHGDPLK